MRPSHLRSSWPVWSMLGAALALLTASLAGSGALDGSRLVRTGRGAQRLEAADGIPHAHEQDEPDTVSVGLVVGGTTQIGHLTDVQAAPPGHGASSRTKVRVATSQIVWLIPARALAGAPPGPGLRLTHHDVRPPAARTSRPALGRAPPTA